MKHLIFTLLIFISGCGMFKETVVQTKFVEKPVLAFPDPEPVTQLAVEWVVLTKDNLEEKLKQIEEKNGTVVLFAITAQGYQNISMNAAELRRYIKQQQAIIGALKQYYEKREEK